MHRKNMFEQSVVTFKVTSLVFDTSLILFQRKLTFWPCALCRSSFNNKYVKNRFFFSKEESAIKAIMTKKWLRDSKSPVQLTQIMQKSIIRGYKIQ